jgi:hypothetical protein
MEVIIVSEEIKEILYLQNYIDKYKNDEKAIIKGNRLTTPAMLDYLEVKALLDYITNLQQKVEQLENIRKEAIDYIENNWITYNDSKNLTEFNEELPVFIKEINILLNILNKGEKK